MSAFPHFGEEVLLLDTSVWQRADRFPEPVKHDFERALIAQRIAIAPVVVCELLYLARNNRARYERWRVTLGRIHRYLVPDRREWMLVEEAYHELHDSGQLESLSLTDIVLGAIAACRVIPLVHLDDDFDRVSALRCMTTLDARRLVPPGTPF